MTTAGQDPPQIKHITKDQLKTILSTFAQITWPAPAQTADWLLTQLGWERTRLRVAHTHLPVSRDSAGIGLADGPDGPETEFTSIHFNAVDFSGEPASDELWRTFQLIVGWAIEMIGVSARTKETGDPAVGWDLPGGGVELRLFDTGVTMYLKSKEDVELEQFERENPNWHDDLRPPNP